MKKIFKIIGLISLTFFSFFLTEKTTMVVNNMDDIMVEIKNSKAAYKTEPKDAIIIKDTIIPGINGRTVNINKSYKNMKINGYFSEDLFIYDYQKPKISLENNKDKYIIKGNPIKRMVSLIFKVYGDDNIDDILNITNNYNIKSTFFIDYTWFTNNNDKIKEIIDNGHTVSIMMDDYNDSNFDMMDVVLKKVNKQKIGFCYLTNNIDPCILKENYIIKPTEISSTTPLVEIKENLESGSLLSLEINREVKKELSTIIIYIKSKGYNITNLEEHILE